MANVLVFDILLAESDKDIQISGFEFDFDLTYAINLAIWILCLVFKPAVQLKLCRYDDGSNPVRNMYFIRVYCRWLSWQPVCKTYF